MIMINLKRFTKTWCVSPMIYQTTSSSSMIIENWTCNYLEDFCFTFWFLWALGTLQYRCLLPTYEKSHVYVFKRYLLIRSYLYLTVDYFCSFFDLINYLLSTHIWFPPIILELLHVYQYVLDFSKEVIVYDYVGHRPAKLYSGLSIKRAARLFVSVGFFRPTCPY